MISFILLVCLFVFIFGVCIGSFLNVVILRAFSNESIIFPASKCPKCQHPLKWYHNIPVLSYIFLRGKCAFCKEKISIQYPIVELLTGFIFLLVFLKYYLTVQALFMWLFASLFIVMSVSDLKEKVIFDKHAYIFIGSAFIFNLFNLNPLFDGTTEIFSIPIYNSIISSILGACLGIVVMEVLARTGYLFAGTRAFGEGDTLLAAGMGALFGWHVFVLALICSIIIQLVFTLPLFIVKLFKRKDYITSFTFLVFILAIILIKQSSANFIFSAIMLVLSGGYLCYRLLKDMRKDEGSLMMLPFGPAMLLASFFIIMIL